MNIIVSIISGLLYALVITLGTAGFYQIGVYAEATFGVWGIIFCIISFFCVSGEILNRIDK